MAVRRRRSMGNGISRNPSGTLDSGQCSRTSVDWRSRMCQMGAKVERCRSPWCTGSLQDDDLKRGRRCSTSHKIDDDAHYDRRTPWGVAVHCGRRRHPGTVAIEFSGETGSDDQFAPKQAHPGGHRTTDVTTGLTPVTFAYHKKFPSHLG